ncbi:30S ribosome-binding factor RbfA [Leifsonia sp. 2TAF2]|uniref:30S ribosome-binding factor RbfA n=1 Tax=Leifsonia sp. 2TAF2 TaxID=3233009 RepID=UPI003F9CB522
MADPARARKLADRIKEIVAKRLDRGLRDPRLGFVTITDVQVTGDLQHATVFYTVYGTEQEREDSAAALAAATGMLRSEVGKNITARLTPTLAFQLDAIPENAAHIEGLLREARERDTEVAGLAASAAYAGDEDPYVKPRDFDEDDEDEDDEADADADDAGADDADEDESTQSER